MTTQTIMHSRLQGILGRFDSLTDVVGPLDPNKNPLVKEVQGLLSLCAEQCSIAAAILDTAENVGITLASTQALSEHRLADPHRKGRMVVVPGHGEEAFPFPNVDSLVSGALGRIGGKNRRERPREARPDDFIEEPAYIEKPLTFVMSRANLDHILRTSPEEGAGNQAQPKTPTRDVLRGGTAEPQICFLRDAEKLVEGNVREENGVKIIEFVVLPHGDLPAAVCKAAETFLTNADWILTAAENLWKNRPPANSAVAIPDDEESAAGCSRCSAHA